MLKPYSFYSVELLSGEKLYRKPKSHAKIYTLDNQVISLDFTSTEHGKVSVPWSSIKLIREEKLITKKVAVSVGVFDAPILKKRAFPAVTEELTGQKLVLYFIDNAEKITFSPTIKEDITHYEFRSNSEGTFIACEPVHIDPIKGTIIPAGYYYLVEKAKIEEDGFHLPDNIHKLKVKI